MKVVVTGVSGFLGRSFYEYLMLQHEHELWGVDLVPHPDGVLMDVADAAEWLGGFDQDIDLLIHLAAPVGGREKIERDPLYNADSLRLDAAAFTWAVKHAKTVLYPSSSAVYGHSLQGRDAQALPEIAFSPRDPSWPAPDEMYGFTKLAGEVLAWKSAAYGLNALCIRPFSGYGPGQSFDYPVPSIAARVLRREDPLTIWGSGDQSRDFIYVTDLVKIAMKRIEEGVSGYRSMNIGSGHTHTFRHIAQILAETVGYEPHILPDPARPQGVLRRFADTARMARYVPDEMVGIREGLGRVLQDVEQRLSVSV